MMPKGKNLTDSQNLLCTVALVTLVFGLSVGIANLADVMCVIGATACTWIGFNLPMMFYLKLYQIENGNKWGWRRIAAHIVNLLFIALTITSLTVFV